MTEMHDASEKFTVYNISVSALSVTQRIRRLPP